MKLETIKQHLSERCPILQGRVRILTSIDEIAEPELDTPAAYVLWRNDSADPNTGGGQLVSQAVTRQFVVLIIGRVPRHDAEPIEDVREEVFAALIGWEAEGRHGQNVQVTYGGGEAGQPDAGLMTWQETYQYTEYLRFTP